MGGCARRKEKNNDAGKSRRAMQEKRRILKSFVLPYATRKAWLGAKEADRDSGGLEDKSGRIVGVLG